MASAKTVNRNIAVATLAASQGKAVRMTYRTKAGKETRRTIKPVRFEGTLSGGVVLRALDVEAQDAPKSFRMDSALRMVIVP